MVSNLVNGLNPSATVEIQETLAALTAKGVDIVRLNAGEPDMPTPPHIVEAAIEALKRGETRYTPASGIYPLRQALSKKLKEQNNLDYEPSEIVLTTGAKQAIVNALLSVVNPGDEVIILTPAWVSYPDMVKIAGGKPVMVRTADDYQPDIELLRASITDKTKMILVNSPNNPSGAVYTDENLEAIADLALERGLWVLSDEIYEKLIYHGRKHTSIISLRPELKEQAIVVNGFSKSYAMTGWRAGYLATTKDIAKASTVLTGHITSNVTTFVQWACIAALEGGEACIEDMRQTFERRQLLIEKGLNSLHGFKATHVDGAFYLMPDVSALIGETVGGELILSSKHLAKVLLDQAHVAVIPGEAFFAPGTLRVSYAASEQTIEEAIRRIAALLNK
ncbi:MAG TPA: pyridoxal phosphate-dependent aminotransferase [Fastidiosipila sp.]|nr:pyridoxal phosphate-dependent aminotransferase [Fastidiosipila sp.]